MWPHQWDVFVWVVVVSTGHGHYWAEVCDSAVTGWSSWSQLHYILDKQIKNNKVFYVVFFHYKIYLRKVYLFPLYGKTQKDSAFPKQSVNFSCVSGSGRTECVIDYIFGNIYTIHSTHIISCVCDNIFPKDLWAYSTGTNVHSWDRAKNSNFPSQSWNFLQRGYLTTRGRKWKGVCSLQKVLLHIGFKKIKIKIPLGMNQNHISVLLYSHSLLEQLF